MIIEIGVRGPSYWWQTLEQKVSVCAGNRWRWHAAVSVLMAASLRGRCIRCQWDEEQRGPVGCSTLWAICTQTLSGANSGVALQSSTGLPSSTAKPPDPTPQVWLTSCLPASHTVSGHVFDVSARTGVVGLLGSVILTMDWWKTLYHHQTLLSMQGICIIRWRKPSVVKSNSTSESVSEGKKMSWI